MSLLVGPWANMLRADDHVYTLAIVPQYTPLIIHRNWQPLLARLQRDVGIKLRVKTYNNFRQFLSALRNGEPDFSYLAPYHLVLARRAQGYQPLIRDDSKQLVGLLLVRKDSPLSSVHELDGKTIAFPSPNAFAASLYMRSWLRKNVGIDFTPRYVGTHDNVYRHIARGQVHAGSGVNSTLASQPSALRQRLRILYKVPGVVTHPFAVHPRVPEKIQARVQEVMLDMIKDPEGRHLLNAIQIMKPIKADYQRDYLHLESMGIE
ncbi:MAG: phosphate/phosphite/phosphonate ABC transporter substrate-binding protein [Gammaproteobacteria bacterium]|nr:phosphate/phosphite/phosphonate ABC transporter substrate-binding protein [Gammaproteobacteria bacterium]